MSDCPPRFSLVQLTTGDLSEDQATELESHVEGCPPCAAKLAALQQNVAIFEHKREANLAQIKLRLHDEGVAQAPRRWGWRWIPTLTAPLAAAAAILLLVWAPTEQHPQSGAVRFKGALSAKVIARRAGQQFVVKNGAKLTALHPHHLIGRLCDGVFRGRGAPSDTLLPRDRPCGDASAALPRNPRQARPARKRRLGQLRGHRTHRHRLLGEGLSTRQTPPKDRSFAQN